MAAGSTVKGIVSLYNKGFVPKKTGKVSKRSMFAVGNKKNNFYDVGGEKNDYDNIMFGNTDLYVALDSQEFPNGQPTLQDPTLAASSNDGQVKRSGQILEIRSEERQAFGNQGI